MRYGIGLVGLFGLVVLSACASMGTPLVDESDYQSSKEQQVQVVVANDAVSDVDVYAYRAGQRVRLASVSAHSSRIVDVPEGMANPGHVQLLVHPVDGRANADFLADEVAISGEDHALLHITPTLTESVMTVVPGSARLQ
jgi:hypothetical protein